MATYKVVATDRTGGRGGYDVVRNEPTVVASELRLGEAEALAFALNTQARIIEGKLK